MTQAILDSLPIPARIPLSREEDAIANLALSLATVGDDFDELRGTEIASFYPESREFPSLPDQRHSTMCEIDARVTKVMGLGRGELMHIFGNADTEFTDGSFPQLFRREMKEYGEFRTRRLVLEAWDRLFGD